MVSLVFLGYLNGNGVRKGEHKLRLSYLRSGGSKGRRFVSWGFGAFKNRI